MSIPSLPFSQPEIIFAIVLLIMLLAPLLLDKLRVPSIVGLIIAGVLIGPHGFHILERGEAVELFGTIGLIYLMFLVGLEVDIIDLKKNKNKSILLGSLSFLLPLGVSFLAAYYFFDMSFVGSLLVAAAIASHTLIAYPIVNSLGIAKSRASTISFGATIIVDTAVLLMLAFISGSVKDGANIYSRLFLVLSIIVFSLIVLKGIPLLTRWFFKNVTTGGSSQYIFILTIVLVTSVMAEFAGIEPILGAFLAGIALNPYIPHVSPLMNRVVFIGNTLFIPFFLIGVGMMVDVGGLFTGWSVGIFVAVFFAIAAGTKYLAAYITQKVFKYSLAERNLIFGLTSARAAATIAVVMVGYNLELIDISVLNGTVIIILLTSLTASLATQSAGKIIAESEKEDAGGSNSIHDRILIPIANPKTIEGLMHLAFMLKNRFAKDPVYPMSVVGDDEHAETKIKKEHSILQQAVEIGTSIEKNVHPVTRVDHDVASGIIRAAKELSINKIVIGWDGKQLPAETFYDSILGKILNKTSKMIVVSKVLHPCNTFKRIFLAVPNDAQHEPGFYEWIQTIKSFAKQIAASIEIFANEELAQIINYELKKTKQAIKVNIDHFDDWDDFLVLAGRMKANDLIIFIKARKNSISFHSAMDVIPQKLMKYHDDLSVLFIYPHQENIQLNEKNTQSPTKKKSPLIKRVISNVLHHKNSEEK